MVKDKKKTLTISSNLKKKIDTSRISPSGKKTYSVDKKKKFRPNKSFNNGIYFKSKEDWLRNDTTFFREVRYKIYPINI